MVQNEKYKNMYEYYKKGYSLQEVGKMFRMTRQSVYSGFKRRNFKLRKKKVLPFKFFKNEKFTPQINGYYRSTINKRKLMHRVVWEFYKGKIPKNHDIHHINKNISDNKIENLELYTKSEHARKFNTGSNQYIKRGFKYATP